MSAERHHKPALKSGKFTDLIKGSPAIAAGAVGLVGILGYGNHFLFLFFVCNLEPTNFFYFRVISISLIEIGLAKMGSGDSYAQQRAMRMRVGGQAVVVGLMLAFPVYHGIRVFLGKEESRPHESQNTRDDKAW